MQELSFLHSALCLTMTDIYMKFREDSLNGFQVIEQILFCDRVRRNNSKSINARVIFLALCTLSNVD